MTRPSETFASTGDLLLSVARSVERVDSTAPSIDEVDAVVALDALARAIVEHNRRLLAGEPVDWDALVDRLGDAERACQLLRSSTPRDDDEDPQSVVGGVSSRAAVTRPSTERLDTGPIYG